MNKETNKYFWIYGEAVFKLVRLPNLLLILITQYLVYAFIEKNDIAEYGYLLPSFPFFILTGGTILVAAAGYIINDYYDIKIDLVNKPDRIVIGKTISRRHAILTHTLFNFLAIFLGLILSWKVALYFTVCAFLLWLYSNYLKRTPLLGNTLISLLTAATIWIISLYYKHNYNLIYLYSIFAFFISLIREVIKDMEDMKGDANYGCKTLPILIGIRKTKLFLVSILILFIILLVKHFENLKESHNFYFHYLLILPLLYLFYKLIRADKQKDFTHLSSFCKWYMLAGVLSLGII